ncbi:carnitine O-acetyltransferase-like isoform X2 [Stegodyphus dumicola]|uniref:carnitine O-acetyltransferase-like isoform X2 n=1 Tax=Stegodyphus dumicola TaxID=202533 RepID=UPI0015AD8C5B|nr:carnitine O-acetyltransferase-like isoform X2 [Stegodyphus dumicola]
MALRFYRSLFRQAENFANRYLFTTSAVSVAPFRMGEKLQAHQQSLPRLPVPPLHPSLEKYLLSVRPLLTEEEYHNTEKVVKEFGAPGGLGVKLHTMLKERAKVTENWLDEWWLNSAYLEFRMPLVLYSSPGLVFPLKDFNTVERQLRYAARLVAGALDFKKLVDSYSLPLDMMGGQPLDMSQYYKIFSTCRIPGYPKDSLALYGMDAEKPRHIVVAHNNHYFSVDVYGDDGAPLNESQLLGQFLEIVKQSQYQKSPIGVLTTLHRDAWAKAYKRLRKYDALNKESIQAIQKAIFLLCLDKKVPDTGCLNRKTHVALQTIHGGGAKWNAGNRWYDKTIQFIVGEDGVVGLTYEHSPAEGPPITSMMDHIVQYLEKTRGNKWLPSSAITQPKKLRFKLSDDTMKDIAEAEQDLENLVSDLEMSCFTYEPYGKEFIKSQKLSPDSYIQMAIQLAFYKIHNQIAATYESASSRKFLHGRTETIRSASMEALDYCKIMTDKSSPVHTKAAALRSAVDAHKEYTLQAVNGLGIDRLLLGLKKIALECGMNIPELFLDAGYTTSTHFKLSTSQVPSKVDAFMCYGPLVPDGYACCYNPRPSSINFGLSACNSSPETHSSKFMNHLTESLTEMHDVIIQSQKAKL